MAEKNLEKERNQLLGFIALILTLFLVVYLYNSCIAPKPPSAEQMEKNNLSLQKIEKELKRRNETCVRLQAAPPFQPSP